MLAASLAFSSAASFAGAPSPAPLRPPPAAGGVAVATLTWVDAGVEREEGEGGRGWRRLEPGDNLRTGDRLRTARDGVARFEFPWMSVTAGPATLMHIPAEVVLSTVLAQGRAEFEGQGREIVKVRTAEAEIRGEGRIVVRRDRERTLVMAMAMDGSFRVVASGRTVVLRKGEGTVVRDGQAPEAPRKLPEAPERLQPGIDPVYVVSGEPVTLEWSPAAAAAHVQVLPLDSDEVLIARDVGRPPYSLVVPWVGTYRWRVSSRDPQGLEGGPSEAGYVCVVER